MVETPSPCRSSFTRESNYYTCIRIYRKQENISDQNPAHTLQTEDWKNSLPLTKELKASEGFNSLYGDDTGAAVSLELNLT